MSIKTCVVMGTFQIGNETGNIFESDVFGLDSRYATANDFIKDVVKTFKTLTDSFKITSIVIG